MKPSIYLLSAISCLPLLTIVAPAPQVTLQEHELAGCDPSIGPGSIRNQNQVEFFYMEPAPAQTYRLVDMTIDVEENVQAYLVDLQGNKLGDAVPLANVRDSIVATFDFDPSDRLIDIQLKWFDDAGTAQTKSWTDLPHHTEDGFDEWGKIGAEDVTPVRNKVNPDKGAARVKLLARGFEVGFLIYE